MSSGQASESGCYEVAEAAYYYLPEALHLHPAQTVVSGWSLGACRRSHRPRRPQAGGRFDRAESRSRTFLSKPMLCYHGFPGRPSTSL